MFDVYSPQRGPVWFTDSVWLGTEAQLLLPQWKTSTDVHVQCRLLWLYHIGKNFLCQFRHLLSLKKFLSFVNYYIEDMASFLLHWRNFIPLNFLRYKGSWAWWKIFCPAKIFAYTVVHVYHISFKNSAPLIIRHPLPNYGK